MRVHGGGIKTGFSHLTLRFVGFGLSFNVLSLMLFSCLCQLYLTKIA